jgi:putative nucleotidyltransferase with HDIG domain
MLSQVIIGEKTNLPPTRNRVNIETLVGQKLSYAPGSLLRLVKLLSDYSTPRSLLINEINRDPMLVVRILRLANSPIYSFEREIILIDMALTAVGSQTIYDIVVVELAARMLNAKEAKGKIFRQLWEHSIAVAVLTKKISETMEMRGLEESFICGLLHDFGKFIFLNYNSQDYGELLSIDDEFEMLSAEDELFGYNHTEVGSLVARRWGLPNDICHAILNHHNASQSAHPRVVEHIIEVADILANIKGYGTRTEDVSRLECSESAMKLGLSTQFLENIWNLSESNITEIINTFN